MTDSPTPSTSKYHEDKVDRADKISMQIDEINSLVAQFRDLLITIGQPRDCPEVREKIRKLRRNCVEACKHVSELVLPQVQSAMEAGILKECPELEKLFFVTQYFLRELYKSKNLLQMLPMNMSGYYQSRPGPSNIGSAFSQILLGQHISPPDFNQEEQYSIEKDSKEISALIGQLQEYMPKSKAETEKYEALQDPGNRLNRNNGGRKICRWNNSQSRHASFFRGGFKLFCCTARANYV